MSRLPGNQAGVLALAIVLTACRESEKPVAPLARHTATSMQSTKATGTTSTLLGRATFSDADDQTLNVKRKTDDWYVDIKSKPATDVAVQTVLFQPAGQSGWHSHPGPVFIQVVYGTLAFYESDDPTCTAIIRTKGQGYLDLGEHAHIARNETADTARTVVTYFAPPGADLKIDEPAPGNCPF